MPYHKCGIKRLVNGVEIPYFNQGIQWMNKSKVIHIKKINKRTIVLFVISVVLISLYSCLDKFLVLDDTENTYGIYDFFGRTSIDAELKVSGTGKQMINGDMVSTKLKVLETISINKELDIHPGDEVIVNEYFKLYKNKDLYGIPLLPGKSVTSMGTSYKRLHNEEIGIVRIHYDNTRGNLWLEPYINRMQ